MCSPSLRVYVCKNRIAATKDVKTLQMIDTSGSLLLGNLSLSLYIYIYINTYLHSALSYHGTLAKL